MVLLTQAVSIIGSVLVTPLLLFILCIIFLASIGKSIGVRRLYVKILLLIFEYGRSNIEAQQRKRNLQDDSDEDEGYSEDPNPENSNSPTSETQPSNHINHHQNGQIPLQNGNSLINRDDKLILLPDPPNNHKIEDEAKFPADSKQYGDFELSNCFEYIKGGLEAIIEDQVTSRFETEELKNWNLLTRTNTHYEFISWKLTFIWVFGFFIRYFFLFPLRVFICFFGVMFLILTTAMIGYLPEGSVKRWINTRAYLISFRIMARSLSGIINIHDKHYRPRRGGVCVANHTTPIDCIVLSTDMNYSLVVWLTFCTAIVGCIPNDQLKQWVNRYVSIMCFGVLSSALSSVFNYHNPENRPKNGGICVANHTSPIDVLVLMCDNSYSLIGQSHGGFLGLLQRALARASPHIWFERSEVRDRLAVTTKLKEHVSNPKNPPILIFPEGTCINNTSVMQFKKGSFEVGSVIYPVAIKYDPKFGDAFWNSSKYSMMNYLYMMMTSWAIVCDVWYLPPMYRNEDESAIDFANRVKGVIAKQGGLVDLVWDGQLKRTKAKKEWKERQQEEFSKRLKLE